MPTIPSRHHVPRDSLSGNQSTSPIPLLRSKDGTLHVDRYFHDDATWAIARLRDSIDLRSQHAAAGQPPLKCLCLVALYDDTSGHARANLSAFGCTRRWNLERHRPVDACIDFRDSSGHSAAKTPPVRIHPCPYRADRDRSDHGAGSRCASRPFRVCAASISTGRLVVPAASPTAWDLPFHIRVFGLHLLAFNSHQARNIGVIEKG